MVTAHDFPALFNVDSQKLYPVGDDDVLLVGRNENAAIQIEDRACARQQFVLARQQKQFFVKPISRRPPTYLEEQPLAARTQLQHLARLRVGQTRFRWLQRPVPLEKLDELAAESFGDAPPLPQLDVPGPHEVPRRSPQPPPLPEQPDTPPKETTVVRPTTAPVERTIVAGKSFEEDQPEEPLGRGLAIPVGDRVVVGRDGQRADYVLQHPHVSAAHARFIRRGSGVTVDDMESANGTFVNGSRIRGPTVIQFGDRIDIGPFSMMFDGDVLHADPRQDNVELVCRNLTRTVKHRQTGKLIKILDDVSLVIQPGEFVCILGPSGSGKSTMLKALSAREPATGGSVTINGEDLYRNFDALKGDIAVVPQKDVMHNLLGLRTALDYTARLRLPPDTSEEDLKESIDKMIDDMGLGKVDATLVGNLSGGQVKRASLANETISQPSLVFLDEVTSGLDEETDLAMMKLFRKTADSGKTVACITHTTVNVSKYCQLIVVLTEGGKLAYFGPPADALRYFGVEQLGDIYPLITTIRPDHSDNADAARKWKEPDAWKEQFRRHADFDRYVTQRMPMESEDFEPVTIRRRLTFAEQFRVFRRQLWLLTGRYAQTQWADRRALAMMLGQCLLVAILICLLFRDVVESDPKKPTVDLAGAKTPAELKAKREQATEKLATYKKDQIKAHSNRGQILFLMAISCLWFGCNNAAKEIVKERAIYTQERDVNLLVPSYYLSKLMLLGVFSVVQVVILYAVVKVGTGVEGKEFVQLGFLMALAISGVTLGLMISSISTTNDMAITLVPVALIPQIILSGALAKVHGYTLIISAVMITTFWGYNGLVHTLDVESKSEQVEANNTSDDSDKDTSDDSDKDTSDDSDKDTSDDSDKDTSDDSKTDSSDDSEDRPGKRMVNDIDPSIKFGGPGAWSMVVLHGLAFATIALLVLLNDDKRGRAVDRWIKMAREMAESRLGVGKPKPTPEPPDNREAAA